MHSQPIRRATRHWPRGYVFLLVALLLALSAALPVIITRANRPRALPITIAPARVNSAAAENINGFLNTGADVSGTKTVSGTFVAGGSITYTVVLSNSGLSDQLDNTGDEFTDVLPAGLTLVSAIATSGTAVTSVNTVTWNGSIPASGSVTITITANINSDAGGTTISNQGSIAYDADANGTNEANRVTDDPSTGAADDPTSFAVPCVTTVTNLNDSGAGSLRQAIINANSSPCTETINFQPGLIGTITLSSTLPDLSTSMSILGPGSSQLTVSGNGLFRVFNVTVASPGGVTFSGLTIANGNSGAGGGAIFLNSTGTINLTESVLSGNVGSSGGGIYNNSTGAINISDSTLNNNTAASGGGGIYNLLSGAITITNSTFSFNSTGGSSFGGGIYNVNNGPVTVTNSTFSNNSGNPGNGGGIANSNGTVIITNSTFSNNSATGDGGGILNLGSAPVLLRNTIIAINTATGSGPDVNGMFTSNGHNLIGNNSAGTITPASGDLIGTNALPINPLLGPLQNNGGPTQTRALLAGSPALDAGDDCVTQLSGCLEPNITTDQRGEGFTRSVDGPDADTTATVDIGAFEAQVSVEDITDKTTNEDTQLQFTFNVGGAASITTVTATSGNTALVPNNPANIALSGSGSTRTLTINPVANQFGTATITVTVNDVNSQSMSDTFVLNVNAIADTPSVTNATTNEDTQSTSGLVIGRNAVDGAEVTHFKITSITNGTLVKNDSTPINNGDFITVAEGNAGLKFTPAANLFSPSTTFSFQVQGATSAAGAGLSSGLATATITVNPVADTPSVTNATTTVNTQTGSGLVISSNAADSAEVTNFKITSITNGTLFQNNGTQINNDNFITVAQGNAGLKFTPANNLSSPVTTFSFQVQASTSNSNAGLGGSTVTATITVNCGPLVVTNSNDSGAGSLRDIINGACPGSTITFDMTPGHVTSPITLTSGELVIGKSLTITGPGANLLTISGNNSSRVFNVTVASPGVVTFSGLTIANATHGGILNNSTGTINVINSTLSGNSAVGGDGGGISNLSTGTVNVTNSALSNNSAVFGGGIYNNSTGTINVTNSTLSGNSTTNNGGGIFNFSAGTINVTNSTLSGNSAVFGGGINNNSTGPVQIRNSIIALNTATSIGPDLRGTFTTQGHNLIGKNDGSAGFTNGVNADIVGTSASPINPLLAPLASNGGPTQTMALLAGSPALDAGDNCVTDAAHCGDPNIPQLTTDQRGGVFNRSVDGPDADTTATVDIGAFEAQVSVEDITDKTTNEDTQLQFTFNVGGAASITTVTATSGNTALVPNNPANIALSGSGSTRTLTINPVANQFGTATITVTVNDVNSQSMSDTFVLNVNAIADTPSVTNATTNEDTQSTSGLVIGRNAVDGAEVTHFKITSITNGTLVKNDSTPINNGDFITFAEGNAGLKFTPAANLFSPGTTFSFQVQGATSPGGAGLSSGFATATITVNTVADTPSVTNATTTVNTQTGSGLVISRNPADGAEVTNFKITGINNGTLFKNNGTTQINNGDFITIAEGNAGLKFTPANNLSSPVTTFNFQVQASTSGSNAGLGGSTVTATITVNCGSPIVTNSNDSGAGSLRAIINGACPGSTITFDLSQVTSPITLTSGELVIDKNLTISGPGANILTISGISSSNSRVFRIQSGNTVTMTDLTIANGQMSGSGNNGGGVLNNGTLTLTNCNLFGNSTINNRGGGIYNDGTSLTLNNCNIGSTLAGQSNNAPAGGGGIYHNSGTLVMTGGSVVGNSNNGIAIAGGTATLNGVAISNNTFAGGNGGGITALGGTINIVGCLIANNLGNNGGGGIGIPPGSTAIVTVVDTTISGNSTSNIGGGVSNAAGTITLTNVTITNNRSENSSGGGIFGISVASVITTLRNTIVAGNFGGPSPSTTANNISGTVNSSSSFNLIGAGGTGGLTNGANNNQVGVSNALLGPLASNGGATQTHALLAGSPALDAGNNSLVVNPPFSGPPFTDQRGAGFARIADGPDADTTDTVDIGAFEAQVSVEDITDKTTNEDTQLQFTFNVGGAASITTVTATSGNTGLVPNNAANLAVSGSGSTRTLTINPVANQFGSSTITVTVNGANSQSMTDTFVLTVNAVAETPAVTNATTNEDTQTASGLVISRNAADGAEVTHFKISGIANGTLFKSDGTTAILNNSFITAAEGNAGLKFTPAANLFSPSTTFSFQVQGATSAAGAGLSSGFATATITVNAVADTPSVTNATTNEEMQTSSGLVISRNPADGAEVSHFKITGITNGTLFQANGTTSINNGDFITFAQGNAGLRFTPNANLFSPSTTFSFQVQSSVNNTDAGLGGSLATATISVNAVADTPSVTNATTSVNTQTTSGLVITRNAADSTEVTHFKITNIQNGTLFKNNGTTEINNNDFITFAEGNAGLKFTPANNLASPATTFSFQVQASTSSSNAGLGGSTATATITVNGSLVRFSATIYDTTESSFAATITVERVGDLTSTVTVDYATPDDSAAPPPVLPCPTVGLVSSRCDFTTAIGTLRFAPGDATKTFAVLISQDNYLEGPESLPLTLSNVSPNAMLGSPSTATLTIADDVIEPAANPIDDASNFVRQHYHDFLNREPDANGLAFWTNEITSCGPNQKCLDAKRINVSAAFFLSVEFQNTGYLVERLYKASYGDATGTSTIGGVHQLPVPNLKFSEFLPDTQTISQGLVVGQAGWETVLESNKQAFVTQFVQRARFATAYANTLTPTQFVNMLFANAGVTPSASERQAAIDEFGGAGTSANAAARGRALRRVAENGTLIQQEFNRALVLMQYFGYLRRNPDAAPDSDHSGYDFWLTKLNQFTQPGDDVLVRVQKAEMVKAFLVAAEYRRRFGALFDFSALEK